MRVSVRTCLFAVSASLACASQALAGTTGVYLPPAPTGPGGEDSIETSSGTRCRQSINSNHGYVDLGVTGTANSALPNFGTNNFGFTDTRDQSATAYVRFTIPLGKSPDRIDCSQIYKLEISRLEREIELLKLGVK